MKKTDKKYEEYNFNEEAIIESDFEDEEEESGNVDDHFFAGNDGKEGGDKNAFKNSEE